MEAAELDSLECAATGCRYVVSPGQAIVGAPIVFGTGIASPLALCSEHRACVPRPLMAMVERAVVAGNGARLSELVEWAIAEVNKWLDTWASEIAPGGSK